MKRRFILIVIGIIIISGAALAISSGKLILPVEKKESFVADSYENYPTKLCVSGNMLIDENKNEIVLKGLMAPDPQKIFREGNFSKDYYDGIFSFGGNVIRVPVHPDMYVADEYYMWRYLDKYEKSWKYAYRDIIPLDYLDSIPKGQWANNINLFSSRIYGKRLCTLFIKCLC